MKNKVYFALALSLMLAISGCDSNSSTTTDETQITSEQSTTAEVDKETDTIESTSEEAADVTSATLETDKTDAEVTTEVTSYDENNSTTEDDTSKEDATSEVETYDTETTTADEAIEPSSTDVSTDNPTTTETTTVEVTHEPTRVPETTVTPTTEPTKEPTHTVTPTVEPTKVPTPTPAPTITPTPTIAPTPTVAPTVVPTVAPTTTPEPTPTPTVHNHSYDNGVITTPATCTTDGIKTFSCSCGENYTETISAKGHTSDGGKVTVSATCSKEGTKTYSCTVCGTKIKTESIAKVAHNLTTVKNADGSTTTKCTVCGTVTATTPAPTPTPSGFPIGHKPGCEDSMCTVITYCLRMNSATQTGLIVNYCEECDSFLSYPVVVPSRNSTEWKNLLAKANEDLVVINKIRNENGVGSLQISEDLLCLEYSVQAVSSSNAPHVLSYGYKTEVSITETSSLGSDLVYRFELSPQHWNDILRASHQYCAPVHGVSWFRIGFLDDGPTVVDFRTKYVNLTSHGYTIDYLESIAKPCSYNMDLGK